MPKSKKELDAIFKAHEQGVRIDLGGGDNNMPGFINLDIRDLPQVDIVQDLQVFPWKALPDECASLVTASHLLEHIQPQPHDSKLELLIKLLLKKKILTPEEVWDAIGETTTTPVFMRFMDEVWRILKKGGKFVFVVPYAGSPGYWQDPTHINPITEATLAYFDPMQFFDPNNPQMGGLYNIYRPKPWKVEKCVYDPIGNMEVVFEKRIKNPVIPERLKKLPPKK